MFEPRVDERPDDEQWPHMVWPDLDTELGNDFVRLHRATPQDAEALYAALNDEDVWRHVTNPPADATVLGRVIAGAESTGRYIWVVTNSSGEVVGTSSYLEVSPENARLEIGWTLYARSVWGTDINPATKLVLLGHAFDDLAVGRVQLKTDVRNHRSQQAIARLGAKYEGTLRRYQRRRDGTMRDTVLFSITAEDWPAVRSDLVARLGSAG